MPDESNGAFGMTIAGLVCGLRFANMWELVCEGRLGCDGLGRRLDAADDDDGTEG